jgi:hypothetical protein
MPLAHWYKRMPPFHLSGRAEISAAEVCRELQSRIIGLPDQVVFIVEGHFA